MKHLLLFTMLLCAGCNPVWAADKKISELTLLPAASFATGDVIPIVDISVGETKKTRISDLDLRFIQLPGSVYGAANSVLQSTGSAGQWTSTLTGLSFAGADMVFGAATGTNKLVLPTASTAGLAAISNTAGSVAFDSTKSKPVYNTGAQWKTVGSGGGGSGQNLLTEHNGNAEDDLLEVGESGGGTLATITSSDRYWGDRSFSFDASAAADYAYSDLQSVAGLAGGNCLLSGFYKGFDSNITLQLSDGTNVLKQLALAASSTWRPVEIDFTCPSSGSIQYRWYAAADAAIGYYDEMHLGSNGGLSNASQASFLGKIKISGSTDWSRSNTSFGSFSAATGATYTLYGSATSPATMIPAIKFASIPPGTIKIVSRGSFWKGVSTTNATAAFRFSDGTNTFGEQGTDHATSGGGIIGVPEISGSFTYGTAQNNVTIEIQGRVSNTGSGTSANISDNCGANGGNMCDGLEIEVWHFPLASQQSVQSKNLPWRIDANISGANPSLGTSAVTTYTSIDNASLTLTNNTDPNSNVAIAKIGCSSTNPPTGTTCSAGSESLSVAFTPPYAGDFRACASFSHRINTFGAGNLGEARTTFQIIETPTTNAATLSQLGKSRVQSGADSTNTSNQNTYHTFGHRVCGTFTFANIQERVLRLMYEQSVVFSMASSEILADADANRGQVDVHWEVDPIGVTQLNPTLVGSITSNSAGPMREITGVLECDGSSQILSQSGTTANGFATIGNVSSGSCAVTIASGVFSAAPVCNSTVYAACAGGCVPYLNNMTATTFTLGSITDTGGAGTNATHMVVCKGPRGNN